MNKVVLMGRLTRDPEVRYTPTGRVVCQFTLAIDRTFTNQDGQREADFIPVVVWGKQAERLGNTVTKGQRLLVEGSIQTSSYIAKDGTKRYTTEVIADRSEYIEKRSDSPTTRPFSSTPPSNSSFSAAPKNQPSSYDSMGEALDPEKEFPF